jgi:hypothetical protein
MLAMRGARKFEQQVKAGNHLRIERTYGSFSRSFGLPNSVNAEAVQGGVQERRAQPGIREAGGIEAPAGKGQRHDERQQLSIARATGPERFLRPSLCVWDRK